MKIFYFIWGFVGALALSMPEPAFAVTPSLVASSANHCAVGSGTGHACALGAATQAGDTIFACGSNVTPADWTGTTDGTNTYVVVTDGTHPISNIQTTTSARRLSCYVSFNVGAGSFTPSMTTAGSSSGSVLVFAMRGLKTSSAIITSGTTQTMGSASTQTCNTLTPTAANQAIISVFETQTSNPSDITAANGETRITLDGTRIEVQWKLTPNTTPLNGKVNFVTTNDGAACGDVIVDALADPASFDSVSFAKVDGSHYRMTYDTALATNAYVAVYPANTANPSAAVLIAGTGAHGTATEAATNSADTLDVTVSDGTPFPLYKVCGVASGAGGNSAVSCTDNIFLDPPAGFLWITLTSVDSGSFCADFNTAVDPDLVSGDVLGYPAFVKKDDGTTDAGLSVSADCTAVYNPAGDFTRRRALNWLVYDYSVQAYHASDIDAWWYDPILTCLTQPPDIVLKTNVAMNVSPNPGNIDYTVWCSHPSGDAFTTAYTSGLPTGLSHSVNTTSGTSSVENELGAMMTANVTDSLTGQVTSQNLTIWTLTGLLAPDCTSAPTTATSCQSLWVNAFHNAISFNTLVLTTSQTVAAGNVISQTPTAGTDTAPYSSVTLTISTGKKPRPTSGGGRLHLKLGLGL